MTEQHAKDMQALLHAYEVIRDVTNRLHECERNLTECQKRCSELVEENRRLKTGD